MRIGNLSNIIFFSLGMSVPNNVRSEDRVEWLPIPRGESQFDLGYRRFGLDVGWGRTDYFVRSENDELNVSKDEERRLYFNPLITLPLVGSENGKGMLFGDYDGMFTQINPGTINGIERKQFIGGGGQFTNGRYGLGTKFGGIMYNRVTTSGDMDVTTTTEQVGNGFGLEALFRGPRMLVGYDYENLSLDLNVKGSIEYYGGFSGDALVDVFKNRLYGGPLLNITDKLNINPYGFIETTKVVVDGDDEIILDQWNKQFNFGIGTGLWYSPFEHLTFGVNGEWSLFKDVETQAVDQKIQGNDFDVSGTITYRP